MSAVVDFAGKEYELTWGKVRAALEDLLGRLEGASGRREVEEAVNGVAEEYGVPWPLLVYRSAAAALVVGEGARMLVDPAVGMIGFSVEEPFPDEYLDMVERAKKLIERAVGG